jgi:hypothetical protein
MYTIEYQFRGKVMKPGNGRKLRYHWDEIRSYHLSWFDDFLVHLLAVLLHPDARLVRVKLW